MSDWVVILDPEDATSGRTELDLHSGAIMVDQAGIDWGTAEVTPYNAEQEYGEYPVARRVPNRTITLPLFLGAEGTPAEEEQARAKLQQKVAQFQNEGGVLKRERAGEITFADITTATLVIPDKFGATAGVEPNVSLVLSCLPDFYGANVELEAQEGAGFIAGKLQAATKDAVIAGDYAGRVNIQLTNSSEHDQKLALWGLRSRYYDAASTAKTAYGAQELCPLNGAVEESHTGAYGGKWVKLAEPIAEAWHPVLCTDVGSEETPATHVGTYRVVARCQGTLGQQVRFSWSTDDATVPTSNPTVVVPTTGSMFLLDLGTVTLQKAPVGTHWWRGFVEVNTGATSAAFYVDELWLQPVGESAGIVAATPIAPPAGITTSKTPGKAEEKSSLHSGEKWQNAAGLVSTSGEASVTLHGPGKSSAAIAVQACGFAIPTGATVEAIGISMSGSLPQGTLYAQLLKAGSLAGNVKNSNTTQFAATDLWGTTWTYEQVNASTFGVAVWVIGEKAASLWGLKVEVRFRLASGRVLTQDAVLYAKREAALRYDGCFREDKTTEGYVAVSTVLGDLPRLPPSGLEDRPCELFVKSTVGGLVGPSETAEPDSDIDTIKARVSYQPTVIGRS